MTRTYGHRSLGGLEGPLTTLGQLLRERGLRYELLAIGGSALQLLGRIVRPTRDIDVVALVDEGRLVSVTALPGPLQRAVEDTAKVLGFPSAWFKHVEDLRRLEPTADELRAAAAWARTHDPSEGFARELRGALRDLGSLMASFSDLREHVLGTVRAAGDESGGGNGPARRPSPGARGADPRSRCTRRVRCTDGSPPLAARPGQRHQRHQTGVR